MMGLMDRELQSITHVWVRKVWLSYCVQYTVRHTQHTQLASSEHFMTVTSNLV
jgi:hypothetical protein